MDIFLYDSKHLSNLYHWDKFLKVEPLSQMGSHFFFGNLEGILKDEIFPE